MATVVRMPEVLTGVLEAAILNWLVERGQAVSVGTPLAEVETEKAVVEYPSETEGTVLEILVEAGGSVPVGHPIIVIGAPGETWEGAETPVSAPPSAVSVEPTTPSVPPSAPVEPIPLQTRLLATPLVRRMARDSGFDLSTIRGTGPQGRIVRRDLEAVISQHEVDPVVAVAPPAQPVVQAAGSEGPFDEIPVTGMRRAIARRLTESWSSVPHFFLSAECRVDALLALRRGVNESQPIKVSVNDFVVKAIAGALMEVSEANATWGGDVIRRHKTADIAVAVAVEGGLVTPVVRGADRLTVTEISTTIADLAERAKAGRLKQHELEGGSFSVSNLGMYGVTEFSAIINPPHAGILAVGAAKEQPVVEEGELAVGTIMTVTLSADHRVVDGAVGAQLLGAFQRRMERPLVMLV